MPPLVVRASLTDGSALKHLGTPGRRPLRRWATGVAALPFYLPPGPAAGVDLEAGSAGRRRLLQLGSLSAACF
jgi:hypothetical protein